MEIQILNEDEFDDAKRDYQEYLLRREVIIFGSLFFIFLISGFVFQCCFQDIRQKVIGELRDILDYLFNFDCTTAKF